MIVTRNGKPAAVLISPDDLESLEETLAILSDPALMAQIQQSREMVEGDQPGVALDELQARSKRDSAA